MVMLTLLSSILLQSADTKKIHTEVVEYRDGDTVLEGFLAYDASLKAKRPGILIIHDWMGVGDYAKERATQLAALGYIAFAADIYGKGVRPKNSQEAGALATQYKTDRKLYRQRLKRGWEQLKSYSQTDSSKTAAIGYCFGGTGVLELARSGAKLSGVVSFHGGLSTPEPKDANNIRSKVLVLHGADDPLVPEKEVLDFQAEMRAAKVDWQFVSFGGAVHSFSSKAAGNDPSKGFAYNERADRRSFEIMQNFFSEIF